MTTHPRPVRYRCELHGRVDTGEAEALKVRVLELSEAGAFLEEAPGFDDRQVDDEGQLTLALPGGAPWTGAFRVSRLGVSRRELRAPRIDHLTVSARGYGVEFLKVNDDELERLRDFLELLEER